LSQSDGSRLRLYQVIGVPYAIDAIDPAAMAGRLQARLGIGAQQFVVDRIVDCIKNSDMEAAHAWDEIGQLIDSYVANDAAQPVTISHAVAC
jgi:hypothetical protein